ncbi:MAG: phosphoribosylaminoimidazolesuccinocarboxamide synthase [Candidatus Rariloculaceae bacterium]
MTKPLPNAVFKSALSGLELIAQGKVRDIYRVDDNHLLIVASDRISAFDVVLPDPIPGKGIALTSISNFWFDRLKDTVPNHLTDIDPNDVLSDPKDQEIAKDRSVVVKSLNPLPIESVVRGYLIGSGWKDYRNSGSVSGIALPSGLELAEQLRKPLFTPSTKAAAGDHDENISATDVDDLIGTELRERVEEISLQLYSEATQYANEHGIIIADTKFEFGLDKEGVLYLIDELFTPDSSRFWPVTSYKPGTSPPSFDKQYVRDYLETLDWDKTPPGPRLPSVVIARTHEKYFEAFSILNQ